jgi:hypothetical protein
LDDIIAADANTYFESVNRALTNPHCGGCNFVSKCATRGVQRIMRTLQTDECLSILSKLSDKADW